MNHKVLSLTKVFLKNSFKNYMPSVKTKQKKTGMLLLYMLAFVYLAGVMGFVSYGMITSMMQIHQEAVFLGVFLLGMALLLVFQSIFSCMNVFYFSKDVEYVLPLPLRPVEILMAKFNTMLVTEYIMEFIIGFIPFLLYGILTGASIFYYIMAVIVLMVFPIFPILIASLLVMIIMSFAKITKKRDTYQFIATIILILVIFGIQFFISGHVKMSEEQMLEQLVQTNGLVQSIGQYFVTLLPSVQAMTATNIGTMLLELIKLLAITAAAYGIFMLLGQKIYFKGAIDNQIGNGTAHKKIKGDKVYKPKKIAISYVKKEFMSLVKNPIFLMQCILPPILFPFLFLGVFVLGIGGEEQVQMDSLLQQIQGNSTGVLCILVGVTQFFMMMSYTSVTAISRDGQNAVFMKYIPVSFYKQIHYKAMPAILLNLFMFVITLGIVYYKIPNIGITTYLAAFVIATLLNILQSELMVIVDLKRPKLEWTTEYAVVKQNMNMIFTFFVCFIVIAIIAIIGGVLGNTNVWIGTILLLVLSIVGVIVVDRYIYHHQTKLMEKII
ncbi:MAG: putative ABC transporter permease subunit [Clostridia bacterium]